MQLIYNDKAHNPFGVAAAITDGFFNQIHGINIFGTKVYSTLKNKTAVERAWNELLLDKKFQALHSITTEKAEKTDARGATLLFIACQSGALEDVITLLDRGADPSRARRDGATPLSMAC